MRCHAAHPTNAHLPMPIAIWWGWAGDQRKFVSGERPHSWSETAGRHAAFGKERLPTAPKSRPSRWRLLRIRCRRVVGPLFIVYLRAGPEVPGRLLRPGAAGAFVQYYAHIVQLCVYEDIVHSYALFMCWSTARHVPPTRIISSQPLFDPETHFPIRTLGLIILLFLLLLELRPSQAPDT